MPFADRPLSSFLDALSSPEPTPGGGTAAAVAGAMGVSLLIMVTGLSKSKTNADAEKAALAAARAGLVPLCAALVSLADEDTKAFDEVMAAYRLPKGSDAEKAARAGAVQKALKGATLVPLRTLGACAEAMRHAVAVAESGNRAAASDAGVAVALLAAAGAGAEANVRINLDGLRDEAFRASTAGNTASMASALAAARAKAVAALA